MITLVLKLFFQAENTCLVVPNIERSTEYLSACVGDSELLCEDDFGFTYRYLRSRNHMLLDRMASHLGENKKHV